MTDLNDTPLQPEPLDMKPDFDIDVPDIPMPQEAVDKSIHDDFEGAFKFAFLGCGQGGSRIAKAFSDLGYRRVGVLNTAEQDLASVQLPVERKLALGGGGAGKDPAVASRIYHERQEDVLDFMRRCFGPDFDRIFVCAGAGGGTGAGTVCEAIGTAKELMASLKIKDKGVGVIVALPQNSEGSQVSKNAYEVLTALLSAVETGDVSPLIILDNERINTIHPDLPVNRFWTTANDSVAKLFHLFNRTAVQESRYTAFDRTDLETILDSGLIVFGATPVRRWDDATDISYAVRDNLKRNMLAGGIDLSTGRVAGAIIVGGTSVMDQVPQAHLDHAFEQLARLLKKGNTVHRGIYLGNRDNLVVYTMIGGLGQPKERLAELKRLSEGA